MVEAVAAAARETKKTTTSAAAMKKKLIAAATKAKSDKDKDKERRNSSSSSKEKEKEKEKERQHCGAGEAAESPSYRLALKSLFSCRNSHAHHRHHQSQHAPAADGGAGAKKLGCSASICKLKDNPRVMMRMPPDQDAAEPCKPRRASVSACSNGSSERERERVRVRSVKKPLMQHGGSLSSSSTSSTGWGGGGSSFRASMQLRRLSGCYECHMVVDPISGVFRDSASMRAAICPCPDCGEIFVRQESLDLHQAVRHAVSEMGSDDTSRNIIEIIFQSSWLKKQSPVCAIDRILKVHNAPATLARFESYRESVKAKAAANHHSSSSSSRRQYPRCTADGNELLRFHCATLACDLGLHGATSLCDHPSSACGACGIIRDGFKGSGVRTMATSGRAHDAAQVAVPAAAGEEEQQQQQQQRRAMLVCRVIAGRVKRPAAAADREEEDASLSSDDESQYDSVAGCAGVYSNLEELEVFNPRAILPCFVLIYKA